LFGLDKNKTEWFDIKEDVNKEQERLKELLECNENCPENCPLDGNYFALAALKKAKQNLIKLCS